MIRVGEVLPTIRRGPVTHATLAQFADAAGDHSPIHVDRDVAIAAGFDDVIGHGMLSMAYMGQCLTNRMPQHSVKEWKVRFIAPTPVGATVTCGGEVFAEHVSDGIHWFTVKLFTQIDERFQTMLGTAIVKAGKPSH